jgi:hypothetical protein
MPISLDHLPTHVRVGLVMLCAISALTVASRTALADSMSLSISPEPVEQLTSQITWASSSEGGVFAIVAVNNPGVQCAATPAGDSGQLVTPTHFLEPGNTGAASGAANYTPPSTGEYLMCGWLTTPAGLLEMEGGPVTAATSVSIKVRAPHISLSLSFPRPVVAGRTFTLDLTSTTEVKREVIVEGFPYTRRGCPIDYEAGAAAHLIDTEVTGGPWLTRANLPPLRGGAGYIFCAWADSVGDNGLYPEATAQLLLNLHPKRHRANNTRNSGRRRGRE